jgi:hypothetical protein
MVTTLKNAVTLGICDSSSAADLGFTMSFKIHFYALEDELAHPYLVGPMFCSTEVDTFGALRLVLEEVGVLD